MTLRETLEKLSNEELEVIMQEHIDWESSGSIPSNAQIRAIALSHYGKDNVMEMDRVAMEAFRVYALRAAGMR